MTIRFKKKDASLVPVPETDEVQLFVDNADGLIKTKNSLNQLVTLGVSTAGGDLSGTYPNPTVAQINGVSVPASPTAGQVLTATSGTAATWQTPTGAPTGAAGGDLGGSYPNPSVAKVNGVSVTGTPTSGQQIVATSGSAASWQTVSTTPTGAAGGDLGGSYPNPTVGALQSATTSVNVSAATAPSAGQVLTATSSTAATWQTPAGGSPTGAAGGDLSGTYPNPSVAKVNGVTVSGTPTTGQQIVATSGTAASWQTVSSSGAPRNPIWDPPISADAADEEFTTDVLLSGAWQIRNSSGVPLTRVGDVAPNSYPTAGQYRSSVFGSSLLVQVAPSTEAYIYKSVPSPISTDQLWMAGIGWGMDWGPTASNTTCGLRIWADLAGAPDFNNNWHDMGLFNSNSNGTIDYIHMATKGGSFTSGDSWVDANMSTNTAAAISSMQGFFLRKGANGVSGSLATHVAGGMFNAHGAISSRFTTSGGTQMTSMTGNWAWCGFRVSNELHAFGTGSDVFGQTYALHFIRRKQGGTGLLYG